MKRTLILAAMFTIAPLRLVAQSAPGTDAGGGTPPPDLTAAFDQVSGWVLAAAGVVPDDELDFRPVSGVRTFRQVLAHLVDSYRYYCDAPAPWSDATERASPDRDALLAGLRDATRSCREAYARGGSGPLLENLTHTHLHYGNLVTYLRITGRVPPSS